MHSQKNTCGFYVDIFLSFVFIAFMSALLFCELWIDGHAILIYPGAFSKAAWNVEIVINTYINIYICI